MYIIYLWTIEIVTVFLIFNFFFHRFQVYTYCMENDNICTATCYFEYLIFVFIDRAFCERVTPGLVFLTIKVRVL